MRSGRCLVIGPVKGSVRGLEWRDTPSQDGGYSPTGRDMGYTTRRERECLLCRRR